MTGSPAGLRRADVIRVVHELRAGAPVVGGPGVLSSLLYNCGYAPEILYNMELGYATAIATGLALTTPDQKVVALEGDGSLVTGMSVLATVNRYRPDNLIVVVVDDGLYGSFGDPTQQTVTSTGTDLAGIALACGFDVDHVLDPSTAEGVRDGFTTAMSRPGPWFLLCRIPADNGEVISRDRPSHDVVEVAVNMKRAMLTRGYDGSRPAARVS